MKKIYLFIPVIIAMSVLSSCAKEEPGNENEEQTDTDVQQPSVVTRSIEFAADAESTKTYIDQKTLVWEETDKVAIFDGVNERANMFSVYDINGASARIKGEVAASSSSYYGVYPYSQANSRGDGTVNITFPDVQTLDGYNVSADGLITIGVSSGTSMPMRNFFSRISFTTDRSFVSATLYSRDGTSIAGKVDVDVNDLSWSGMTDGKSSVTLKSSTPGAPLSPGTYCFTVLPDVSLTGFTIKLVDAEGTSWVALGGKELALDRNGGQDLKTIDARLETVIVHTQEQMNLFEHQLNSHAGAEERSSLEMIHDTYQVIPNSSLVPSDNYDDSGALAPNVDRATYPRLKKMADGRYILFSEGGMTPYEQFYSVSSDLETWSEPRYLYKTSTKASAEGTYRIRYMSSDAAVLPDGRIIAVTASRARNTFAYELGYDCGILMRISSDNASSWSEPVMIYDGYCWEPYPLVLPDGTIQVYFTDVALLDTDGDRVSDDNNSGTSMIESKDGGISWSAKKRVVQQCVGTGRDMLGNTVNVYTDQMPCFRVLNDGTTILGFLEASVPDGAGGEEMMLSVIRNQSLDWSALADDGQTGPSGRQTNVCKGTGGYLSTFPSGEILLSCSRGYHSMKIGNHNGTEFYGGWDGAYLDTDWYQPFAMKGNWGCVETIDGHHAVSLIRHNEEPYEGVMFAQFFLNHDIHAENTLVTVDGVPAEWTGKEALFVGSDSDVQAILRASFREGKLYLLVETVDSGDSGKSVLLSVGTAMNVTVDRNGLVSGPEGVVSAATAGKTADGRKGYVCEIALDVPSLPVSVNVTLSNGDGLSLYAPEDVATWPQIRNPLKEYDGTGVDDATESELDSSFWK